MSVSFHWISCCCLESLRHCTGVLLVWFPRSDSVADPDTWGEVSFIGDVCDCTSLFCLKSGVWVLLLLLVFQFLYVWLKWVFWDCCHTTSGIGGSLVVSGLSIAAPEWRRGIFTLTFGLQPEFLQSSHFDWLFLGPDSVFLVFFAGEAVYWLHWLHSSISLWSGLSSHMFHRVDKQFSAFFQLCYSFCSCCCC